MTSRQFTIHAALLISLSAANIGQARADSELEALLAEPVESTAGKSAGTAASAPALSISITAEDLRRHGIRTVAEAYNFLSMGLVSQDPLGGPEVGGRGLMFPSDQSKHILLLIDGHSTNDQENGGSLHGQALGLPMEIIDHIEVVLGPGSVLYGSNAMLGVVNIVTKRAKDYHGPLVLVSSGFSPPVNRAHQIISPAPTSEYVRDIGQEYRFGLGGGREFVLRGLPIELITQLEYYTMDGPMMEWGPQLNRGINFGPRAPIGSWGGQTRNSFYARVWSGYARFIVGAFEIALHTVASRISQPYVRRQDQVKSADFDDPDGARVRRDLGLDLKWRHNFSTAASLMARIYGDLSTQDSQGHEHPLFGCLDTRSNVACARTEAGFAQSMGTEVQGSFDWKGRGEMITMMGVDARGRHVGYQNGSTEVDTGNSTVYSQFDDADALGAIYAQHVARPAGWLILNGGARWDIDSRFGNRVLPRAAIIAEPWSGGTVKAIYSEAFRAPTTDEVNYRNPNSTLVAQGLRPESVRSAEVVLQQRIGAQNIVFGVFRSWWTDMIVRRELSDLPFQIVDNGKGLIQAGKRQGVLSSIVQFAYQYQNVASIDNFGFNAGYDGTLVGGRLAYGLNLTAGYGRLNTPEGKRRVPITPSMFGNARISYDLSHRLPIVAIAAHASDRRLSEGGENSGFEPLPFAPPALDLRGTVVGPIPKLNGLTYRFMGNYAFASSSPYTAGPSSFSVRFQPAPELVPTVRFTFMFGLRYDLGSSPAGEPKD
jgi:outer membrane receptor for ferrienterochelin and colicins